MDFEWNRTLARYNIEGSLWKQTTRSIGIFSKGTDKVLPSGLGLKTKEENL